MFGQCAGMAACEVCGNDYRLSFEVHAAGAVHVFDSFECAIHALAPVCEHCGVRVVGRRRPGQDLLDWQLVYDAGTDLDDPLVRVQADELLLTARRTVG